MIPGISRKVRPMMKRFFKRRTIKLITPESKQISIFHLAWPIFVEGLLMMLVGNMDQYMIASYSENAVGAIGNANQIINLLLIMFSIISIATTILVSHYIGSKNTEKLPIIYTLSFTLNLIFSFSIAIIISLFSNQLFTFMSLPEEIFSDAVTYIKIVGGFIFLQGLISAFSAIFRANKMMKENMVVSIAINIVNVAFNAVLINGAGPIPALGVTGAAIATTISRTVGVIIYIGFFIKKFDTKISLKHLKPFPSNELKRMLSLGIPSAGESVSYSFAMTMITKIANILGIVFGTYVINTMVFSRTFAWFSFFYASAISQATQVIIGNHMGAGKVEEVDKLVKKNWRNSVLISICISLILFIFSDFFFGLFSTDPRVLELGKKIMFVEIFLEIGRCSNLTFVRSLQATGDIRFPTMVGIISMWLFAVGVGYLLATVANLGLVGLWVGMALDENIRTVIFFIRWKKARWKNIRLVDRK